MKKFGLIFVFLLTITLIATFIFTRHKTDLEKMVADVFIRQYRNATEYTQDIEKKEHTLDEDKTHEETDRENQEHENQEDIIALTDRQIKGMGLNIQTADQGKMLLSLSTRGKVIIHPDHFAHVTPKVSGLVKEAKKNIGSSVKQGEIIAILESQDIADLKANYLSAVNQEKLADSILQRETGLYQKGISAGEDFFNAQHAYTASQIELLLVTQKLRALGLDQEDIQQLIKSHHSDLRIYPIYAPMDGVVIMRHMTPGEYIENTATIYEIADLSDVWVEAGIYPKDLPKIKQGQMIEVIHPETNQSAEAELIYISPIVADETITAKVIALMDNSNGAWRPGSFVKVNIAIEQISCTLLISKEAIQKMDGKTCAFVTHDKGFEKRELQLGKSDQKNIEVISGILPGEKYVAQRSFLLKAEMNKNLVKDDD